MNLTQFLDRIDMYTSKMSKEELSAVIHEAARVIPSEKRGWMLSLFDDRSDEKSSEFADSSALYEKLEKIASGELRLDSEYNEMWDDWYDNGEQEYVFKDTGNLLDVINTACIKLHQLADCADYREAYHLGKCLLSLEVQTDGDYYDSMDISTLWNYDLIDFPVEDVVLDTLCAAYFEETPESRTEVMYRLGKRGDFNEWTLEKLMQLSPEELNDLGGFLREFVGYLGNVPEESAEELLCEALSLLNDELFSAETARKYISVHPGIYEKAFDMQTDDLTQLELGKEALNNIPAEYKVRSVIALKTGETALRLGRNEDISYCLTEAFRSDTTPVNFLRALMYGDSTEKNRERLLAVFGSIEIKHEEYTPNRPKSCRLNNISDATRHLVRFFGGEFFNAYSDEMNVRIFLMMIP